MADNFNTIAGWALGAGIVALGASLLTAEYFHHEPVEKGGYAVADSGGSGGGSSAPVPIDWSKADAAKGAEVFSQCKACHSVDAGGANGTGPNIHAIVGKAKASVGGFAYSDALKAKGGSWSFEDLDAWLKSPRKFADGTKMTYAGLGDAEKRGNLIAYLNTQGSNLPLPAGPAPAAEGAVDASAAANAAAPAENATTPAK
jgi:cytochrome c